MGRQLPTYCKHNMPIDGGAFAETKACFKCEMEAKEKQRKLAAYDEQVKLIKDLSIAFDAIAERENMDVTPDVLCGLIEEYQQIAKTALIAINNHLQNQKR